MKRLGSIWIGWTKSMKNVICREREEPRCHARLRKGDGPLLLFPINPGRGFRPMRGGVNQCGIVFQLRFHVQGVNRIGHNYRLGSWPVNIFAKDVIQIQHIGQPACQMRTLASVRNEQITKSRRIVTSFLHANGGSLDGLCGRSFQFPLPYLGLVVLCNVGLMRL